MRYQGTIVKNDLVLNSGTNLNLRVHVRIKILDCEYFYGNAVFTHQGQTFCYDLGIAKQLAD